MTPCGGWLNAEHVGHPYTKPEACLWFPVINEAMRRAARSHGARVKLLDAHQMATSRPGANESGSPPNIGRGLWTASLLKAPI